MPALKWGVCFLKLFLTWSYSCHSKIIALAWWLNLVTSVAGFELWDIEGTPWREVDLWPDLLCAPQWELFKAAGKQSAWCDSQTSPAVTGVPQTRAEGGRQTAASLGFPNQTPRSETKELLSLFISPAWPVHGLFLFPVGVI